MVTAWLAYIFSIGWLEKSALLRWSRLAAWALK
jgi:hypothetical protein